MAPTSRWSARRRLAASPRRSCTASRSSDAAIAAEIAPCFVDGDGAAHRHGRARLHPLSAAARPLRAARALAGDLHRSGAGDRAPRDRSDRPRAGATRCHPARSSSSPPGDAASPLPWRGALRDRPIALSASAAPCDAVRRMRWPKDARDGSPDAAVQVHAAERGFGHLLAMIKAAAPFYEAFGGAQVRLLQNVDDPARFVHEIEYETDEEFELNRQRIASDARVPGLRADLAVDAWRCGRDRRLSDGEIARGCPARPQRARRPAFDSRSRFAA